MSQLLGIIEWLVKVEEAAGRIYAKAASEVRDDPGLCEFINGLAADEAEHAALLRRAAALVKEHGDLPSIIAVNEAARQGVDNYLLLAEKRLGAKKLSKDNIVDCVVSTEFSEWNELFLFVLNTLKHRYRESAPVPVRVQQHKKHIERFFASRPDLIRHFKRIKALPDVWEEKILVVDDEQAVADVMKAILMNEGVIERAVNGSEALRKLEEKYYAAIISDIDMPVMDGFEFHGKARERYPGIDERFLFFTGDEDHIPALEEKGLKYLLKPSSVAEISRSVTGILNRPRR